MSLLVHVEEDVASALPLLPNVFFPGLVYMRVIVAPPHSILGTAYITDIVA